MDKAKVQALHLEFARDIRPLLVANGRNNVLKVASFLSRNVRSNVTVDEMAARIVSSCQSSRTIALQMWMSDFKKIHGEQVHEKLVHIIRHYSNRAALSESEQAYYQQLRQAEVSETYQVKNK